MIHLCRPESSEEVMWRRMSQGQYLVYERASKDEERLFIDTAEEIANEIEEPRGWMKRDPKKHPGGRPFVYPFRQMLLILFLMTYQRKEYREMEAHLKNNPSLLGELGLKKAPGKSTIQRAAARIGIDTLVEMNDSILRRFKKSTA
jgi:hypothetical protein